MIGGWWNKSCGPIGVDLGEQSLRLLQLSRAREPGDMPRAVAAASCDLPATLPTEEPSRSEALAPILRDLVARGGFVGRRAVSCLPSGVLQIKSLRLPKMPDEELRPAVEWEATDRLGMGRAGQTQVQYLVAGDVRQGEESRLELIVMAASTQAVDRHVGLLMSAGLKPWAVDVSAGALARCLSQDPRAADEDAPAIAALDTGYASSKMLILRQGRVCFFKSIEVGGRQFDQAIAARLNVPVSEAGGLRRKFNATLQGPGAEVEQLFGGARRENVDRAVHEVLRATSLDLAREVGLCLRYFSVTFRGKRPDKLRLLGGGTSEPLLARVLSEETGAAVEIGRPLERVDLAGVAGLPEGVAAQAQWAVAVGLALRGESHAAAGTSAPPPALREAA